MTVPEILREISPKAKSSIAKDMKKLAVSEVNIIALVFYTSAFLMQFILGLGCHLAHLQVFPVEISFLSLFLLLLGYLRVFLVLRGFLSI